MVETNFCYMVSEEVGLARKADGGKAAAYIKASMDTKADLTADEYKKMHEETMLKSISGQLKIDQEMLTPITHDEYRDKADDDDE